MTAKSIEKIAWKHKFATIVNNNNPHMISFRKGDTRINVYPSKMTVATCLKHPRKGKTQLFRRNVDNQLLEEIFKNPRIHTRKGYREK